MTGGGDQAERDLLRAGQVSKRFAQLRAILDVVSRDLPDIGRIAGVSDSFDVLAAVQRDDPGAVADLLGGPQVGAWAAWCLRRLRRGEPENGTSVRVHLAQLGSVAAAAALRCGVQVRVRVPVRAGTVSIPSVGRALIGEGDDWALTECTTGPSGVLLDGVPPVEWAPVRVLRAEAAGVPLHAHLDELEPYWRAFGIPISGRLTDEDAARWQHWLEKAWRVLADRHPHRLVTMAAAIRCLVPVEQAGRLGRVSASSAEAPGAVALTEPTDATRLAATLIHESQHFRLSALHDLRPLYREPARNLLYSPWRNDPRPMSGVVHGTMAFAGVADFWLRERVGAVAELEYARHVRQLRQVMGVVANNEELTSFGRALVAALGDTIDRFPADEGSPELRRMADDLVAEHRADWRLRNVVPDGFTVRLVVQAWQRGEPPFAGVTHHPDEPVPAEPSGDNPLTRLAMAWLENPAEIRELAEDPPALAARFPGTTTSDVRLLSGDYLATRDAALTRITTGTANHRDWAALSVAHGRQCADPSSSPLVDRPELIMAAWQRMAADDPGALATLLSRYEAGTSTSDSMRR